MPSLRECARNVRNEAADGIQWIAIWKNGRSWKAETFSVDFDYSAGTIDADRDDFLRLKEIIREDPLAILVNGYYSNIGCYEDGTLPDIKTLADALRWQYEDCHPLVSNWTIRETIPDEEEIV